MFARILFLIGQLAVAVFLSIMMVQRINQTKPGPWFFLALVLPVVLWSVCKATFDLIRYVRNPLQKRQEYFVTGEPLEEYVIEPIVLEGPCVLVFKSDMPDTGVKFNLIDAAEEAAYVSASYWRAGVDFNMHPGKATFRLKAKLPENNAKSLRLKRWRQKSSMSAKFTIEIRGKARLIELPEHAQPLVRGFPVVPLPSSAKA